MGLERVKSDGTRRGAAHLQYIGAHTPPYVATCIRRLSTLQSLKVLGEGHDRVRRS